LELYEQAGNLQFHPPGQPMAFSAPLGYRLFDKIKDKTEMFEQAQALAKKLGKEEKAVALTARIAELYDIQKTLWYHTEVIDPQLAERFAAVKLPDFACVAAYAVGMKEQAFDYAEQAGTGWVFSAAVEAEKFGSARVRDLYQKALPIEEKEGRLRNAARAARKLNLEDQAQKLFGQELARLEQEGLQRGNIDAAVYVAVESGDVKRAVRYYEKEKKFWHAAELAGEHGLWELAAKNYARSNVNGAESKVLQIASEHLPLDLAVDALVNIGYKCNAAELLEKNGQLARAREFYNSILMDEARGFYFTQAGYYADKSGHKALAKVFSAFGSIQVAFYRGRDKVEDLKKAVKKARTKPEQLERQGRFSEAAKLAQERGDLAAAQRYQKLHETIGDQWQCEVDVWGDC